MRLRVAIFALGILLIAQIPAEGASPPPRVAASFGNVPSDPLHLRSAPLAYRAPARAVPGDELWADGFGLPASDGGILCAVQFGGSIVVGGSFSQIGGIDANNIARWDGVRWSPLGLGTDAPVLALAIFDGDLIAGGRFRTAGGGEAPGIARWNGSQWSPMGGGLLGGAQQIGVTCLALYQSGLVAGGFFETAGLRNIARWDGSSWTPMSRGADWVVEALAVQGDTLFAGGAFDSVGVAPARAIAQWNGSDWAEVGGGLAGAPAHVYALAVHDNRLFVGGDFTAAGGAPAQNLAAWDGASWDPLGGGFPSEVHGITEHQSSLYIAAGYGLQALGRWDDAMGLVFLTPFRGFVDCFLDLGDALLVGGLFGAYDPGGRFMGANVLRWQAGSWTPLETWNSSMHGLLMHYGDAARVRALTTFQGNVVATGVFHVAGNPPQWDEVGPIARWDGHSWSGVPFPLPPYSYAEALLAHGDTLYAGGTFEELGVGVSPVCRVVGSSFTLLDTLSLDVKSMVVYQGQLYIGGWRLSYDSPRMGGVYRWDGNHWQLVGLAESASDFPGVLAMAVLDGRLVAGGLFTSMGGVPARNIAAWDGNSWSPLGPGLEGPPYDVAVVYALVTHGDTLIAGGDLGTLGGAARWNGSTWQGLGIHGDVVALASAGGELFAGGWIWDASYSALYGCARWDGTSWQNMGTGLNQVVWCFAVLNDSLFVGGDFTRAGGHPSFGIARWDGIPGVRMAPPSAPRFSGAAPNPFRGSTRFVVSIPSAGHITIVITDAAGHRVAVVEDGDTQPGPHEIAWDGRDSRGRDVPTGVYFVRARFPDGTTQTRKAVRLK